MMGVPHVGQNLGWVSMYTGSSVSLSVFYLGRCDVLFQTYFVCHGFLVEFVLFQGTLALFHDKKIVRRGEGP